MQIVNDFLSFLRESPTVWHAAKEIKTRLEENGFSPLDEKDAWHLEEKKGYFVLRDGAVFAFRMPAKFPEKVLLAASHTDSPALKLKPEPDLESKGIFQLSTEVYGSPLLHTWLDRDLCLAGQVATSPSSISLVHLETHPLIIPSIAPHLERTLVEKGLHIQKQDHLKPVFSLSSSTPSISNLLSKHLNSPILAFDLFLVPLEKPAFLGYKHEFLSSYRLDNLSSAHASLQALLHAAPSNHTIQAAVFWDHEEIGSTSYTGAKSDFAHQILERICLHCKIERESFMRLKAKSLCISSDVAHGFHPNFAEKFDPKNTPHLGKGIVFKCSAEQKYATTLLASSPLLHLCKEQNIPHQSLTSRSDIPSGSTIGPLMAASLGIPTIDIGVPILAMHSIRETIAIEDQKALYTLLKAAFGAPPHSPPKD